MRAKNSVFKLISIEYNNDDDVPSQYPFKVYGEETGFYTRLEKVEDILKDDQDKNAPDYIPSSKLKFCYLVYEYALDDVSYEWAKSRRSYLSDGTLWAENLLNEDTFMRSNDDPASEFLGRPVEKQRFKKGDFVEILDGTRVTLEIVTQTPYTPEEVCEQREKEKEEFCNHDYSDDCYRTIRHNGKQSYTNVVYVFPPRLPVNDELRNKLLEMYKLEKEIFLLSKIFGNTCFKLIKIKYGGIGKRYYNSMETCRKKERS